MDSTLFNLMFRRRGTVSSFEFRAGMAVLLLLVGVYIGNALDSQYVYRVFAQTGRDRYLDIFAASRIVMSFTPNLVPVWTIICFASFLMAMKRMLSLGASRTVAVLSGVLNFMFFASMITLLVVFSNMMEGLISPNAPQSGLVSGLQIAVAIIFVAGLANGIYMSVRSSTEQWEVPESVSRLTPMGFAYFQGRLVIYCCMVSVAVAVFCRFAGMMYSSSYTPEVLSGILSLICIGIYYKYAVLRLRDADVHAGWLAGATALYVLMAGMRFWMGIEPTELFVFVNFVYSIVLSFYIAGLFSLFLLPSQGTHMD